MKLQPIKIASIDVGAKRIYAMLAEQAQKHVELADFIKGINMELPQVDDGVVDASADENRNQARFIVKTHATMAHCSQASQSNLRHKFSPLLETPFVVKVDGILFDKSVAALSVCDIVKGGQGDEGNSHQESVLALCNNSFPHVTVWCNERVKPSESINLPKRVESKKACHLRFKEKVELQGTFSFWPLLS
jgi:hypothetical protein